MQFLTLRPSLNQLPNITDLSSKNILLQAGIITLQLSNVLFLHLHDLFIL